MYFCVKLKKVNEKKNNCICENCEFKFIAYSYLDDDTIQELCDNKEEQSFRRGEIINHEGEKVNGFKYLKSAWDNLKPDFLALLTASLIDPYVLPQPSTNRSP